MEVVMKIILGIILALGVIAAVAVVSLLMAFPIMWCWNYAVVAVWGLPKITWGMAWCLSFLSGTLIKSSLSTTKS